jgi:Glycosyl hydrolases family 35.
MISSNVLQFQGGSFDPWGGSSLSACAELLNHEFERVFYKNDFSFGVAFLNLYMVRFNLWLTLIKLTLHRSLVVLIGVT